MRSDLMSRTRDRLSLSLSLSLSFSLSRSGQVIGRYCTIGDLHDSQQKELSSVRWSVLVPYCLSICSRFIRREDTLTLLQIFQTPTFTTLFVHRLVSSPPLLSFRPETLGTETHTLAEKSRYTNADSISVVSVTLLELR